MIVLYPAEIPIAEIKDVISIVRSQTVLTDKARFAKDVWVIVGFALAQAFGEAPQKLTSAPNAVLSDADVCNCLETLVTYDEGRKMALPIPWAQIAQWAIALLAKILV